MASGAGRSGRGFTLIEMLVVVLIVAVLIGVILVSVRTAFSAAQGVADAQSARTVQMAMDQFRNDWGFGVPLAFDAQPMGVQAPALVQKGIADTVYRAVGGNAGFPVVETTSGEARFVAVYNETADVDFLRGGKRANNAGEAAKGANVQLGNLTAAPNSFMSDKRYSKFSLPIYLSGVLDREVDGVNGPGMTAPARDGTFAGGAGEGSPRPVDAYVEPTAELINVQPTYVNARESGEHGVNNAIGGRTFGSAYVDRYGQAFRYYRWEHGRNSVDDAGAGNRGLVARAADLNVPFVLSDMVAFGRQKGDLALEAGETERFRVEVTGGNAELNGATYAVVGAGPDGFFGTEALSELDPGGAATTPDAVATLRARYQSDNVVVVGR